MLTSSLAPPQIAHYPTLRSIPADLAPPVLEEVELYKQALRKCYKSFGAEMVCFEVARSSGKGGHAHVQVRCAVSLTRSLCLRLSSRPSTRSRCWTSLMRMASLPQICPIPSSLASEAESTFLSQGTKFNYAFEEIADPSTFHQRAQEDGKGDEYFKVDLPGGKSLVHWIGKGDGFSLQFGR